MVWKDRACSICRACAARPKGQGRPVTRPKFAVTPSPWCGKTGSALHRRPDVTGGRCPRTGAKRRRGPFGAAGSPRGTGGGYAGARRPCARRALQPRGPAGPGADAGRGLDPRPPSGDKEGPGRGQERQMANRKINPLAKQALELGPTLVFFAIYMLIKDRTFHIWGTDYSGFIVAALIFVPILLVSIAALWALSGELSRMQIFTGVVVIFFGGLTAWFNDERFFKMKTTIVYGTFAVLLGIGLLRGKSYLQWILGPALPMQTEGWMILTRRLTLGFAVLAVANEVIWRTQSTELWVKLETFAFPLALFLFLMLQIGALNRYMIEPGKDDADKN
jgi:intracellular septation protein